MRQIRANGPFDALQNVAKRLGGSYVGPADPVIT